VTDRHRARLRIASRGKNQSRFWWLKMRKWVLCELWSHWLYRGITGSGDSVNRTELYVVQWTLLLCVMQSVHCLFTFHNGSFSNLRSGVPWINDRCCTIMNSFFPLTQRMDWQYCTEENTFDCFRLCKWCSFRSNANLMILVVKIVNKVILSQRHFSSDV